MKHANKRLIVSLAALVISIALAATSTFAWFTMDATPEVNNINLTVTAQSGLEISYVYQTDTNSFSQSAYKSYIDFLEDANGEADGDTTFAKYLQRFITLQAVTPADVGAYPIIGYVYEKEGVVAGDANTPGEYELDYQYPNSLYETEEVEVFKTENEAAYVLEGGRKKVIRAYTDAVGSFEYVYQKVDVAAGTPTSAGAYVVTSDVENVQAVDGGALVYDGVAPVYVQTTTNPEDYYEDVAGNYRIIRAYYEEGEDEEAEIKYAYVYEKVGVNAGSATEAGEYVFEDPVAYEVEPEAEVNVQATTTGGTPIYNGNEPVYVHKTTNAEAYTSTPGSCIAAYGDKKEYLASSTTNFLTVDAGSNKAVEATAGTYAALRFRFRSLSKYAIHLTKASVTSTAYHGDFLDWDGVDGGGQVLNTNAANAARIGFSASTYTPATDMYTMGTSLNKVYEPNNTKGYTAAGINGAKAYYEFITGHTNPIPTPGYTAIHDADLTTSGSSLVLPEMTPATTGANAGYYVGEVTVYLWIDGADYDCFNIILGDDLAINLFFEGTTVSD